MNVDKKPKAHYEAAKVTRRVASWLAPSTGPNAEIEPDLEKLRNRHRDLARNNPFARRAISAIVNNVIGSGIVAQWKNLERQKRWTQWFESTLVDADGRTNGYGLQSLVMRTVVESGECLVRRRARKVENGFKIPLQIQILEPDFLDHTKTGTLENGNVVVQGVEFNSWGQRVAYYLYKFHPGERNILALNEVVRIPASEVLHVYRVDRPGQVRGVPWGTGAMLRLKMLDDYQDAQLERQRLSACFMAFRRQLDQALASDQEYNLLTKLEPGAIEDLPPGVDITFVTPPKPEDDKYFVLNILRACASDYGIPYEVLTGDLSEVNFSSARLGWNEFGRTIDVIRWQMLVPMFLNHLAKWYLEAEAVANFDVEDPDEIPIWTPPARVLVDPVREIPAIQKAIRAGLLSLPQAIRQQGYDPYILAEEHANYLKYLDSIGIKFESDARYTTSGKELVNPNNEVEEDA